MYKNNKGITLVALVVTVIILAIILSVTFSTIVDNNGIISFSKEYKASSEGKIAKEKVNVMLSKYKMAKMDTGISIIEYFYNLKEKGEISNIVDNRNGTYTITKDGVKVIVTESEVLRTE